MANIPRYTEEDFNSRKSEQDMSLMFNMPYMERIVFQYALRDVCLKEIVTYESKRNIVASHSKIHPKESLPEAKELANCLIKNIKMEPICLKPFNDARECLFRSSIKIRQCKADLDLFEECYRDPIEYAKMEEVATESQMSVKNYWLNIRKRDTGSI